MSSSLNQYFSFGSSVNFRSSDHIRFSPPGSEYHEIRCVDIYVMLSSQVKNVEWCSLNVLEVGDSCSTVPNSVSGFLADLDGHFLITRVLYVS